LTAEAPAIVHLGPRTTPDTIWHATLSLKWDVRRVIEDWTTPVYWQVLGTSGDTRRFRVLVSGPLPDRPTETGEFVMVVRRAGDRPGWWIRPDGTA
jgi:hypothetical protein